MKYLDRLCIFFKVTDSHIGEVLKKGSIAFIFRLVGAGTAFLLSIYIARLLGTECYGIFTLSISIVTILSVFIRLGLETVLLRRVAAFSEKSDFSRVQGYFFLSVRLVLIAGITATFFLVVFSEFFALIVFKKAELKEPLTRMAFFLVPFSLVIVISEALKGMKRVGDATFSQNVVIPGFTLALLIIGARLWDWHLNGVIVVYISAAIAAVIFAWIRWSNVEKPIIKIAPSFNSIVKEGFPFLLITTGTLTMAWSDKILLGYFVSSEQIGIYNAAAQTALVTSMVLISINTVIAPKFSSLHASQQIISLSNLVKKGTLLSLSLVLIPTTILLLWPEIVLSLFGVEFSEGANVLVILSIGQFVNVTCGSVGYLLSMTGYSKIVRNVILITAGLNIFLNCLLIRKYGLEGAAIATAASMIIWNIWLLVQVRRKLKFWTFGIPVKKFSKKRF